MVCLILTKTTTLKHLKENELWTASTASGHPLHYRVCTRCGDHCEGCKDCNYSCLEYLHWSWLKSSILYCHNYTWEWKQSWCNMHFRWKTSRLLFTKRPILATRVRGRQSGNWFLLNIASCGKYLPPQDKSYGGRYANLWKQANQKSFNYHLEVPKSLKSKLMQMILSHLSQWLIIIIIKLT